LKRAGWKLVYIHPAFFKPKLYRKANLALSNFRNSIIPTKLVGLKTYIYNGAWALTKVIEEKMVGLKIGEVSITKKFEGQAQTKRKTKRKTKKK